MIGPELLAGQFVAIVVAMYCLQCNTQNTVTSDYCEACGETLRPADQDDPANRTRRFERHPQFERNWRDL